MSTKNAVVDLLMGTVVGAPIMTLIIVTITFFFFVILLMRKFGKKETFPTPVIKTYLPESLENRSKEQIYPNLGKTALVTGGNGFVGRMIVTMLLDQGVKVRVMDLVDHHKDPNVEFVAGNLLSKEDCHTATQGMEMCFHVAAPHASVPRKVQYDVNVTGTSNLLEAAATNGITRFIFTSSASVIYEGKDQAGADETTPIPTSGLDSYTETKAMAEALVLKANKSGPNKQMLTCAIRPHGIYGPGDRQFFPVLIENAAKGKSKMAIGNGKNIADFTFVGNVSHGHLLGASKLGSSDASVIEKVGGQAFFITNDDPMPFWTFLDKVLTGFGYPGPSFYFNATVMWYIAGITEIFVKVFTLFGRKLNPTFTKSRVQYLSTHHWYSVQKAKRFLDYKPAWTTEEALELCFFYMSQLRNSKAPKPPRIYLPADGTIPKFTAEQVSKHNKEDDAWIIVDGKVYDITDYVEDHVGGDAILRNAGKDSSEGFHGPQHPPTVEDVIKRFYIGDLKK